MTDRFKFWVAILLGIGLLAILGAKWGYDRLEKSMKTRPAGSLHRAADQ